MFKYLTQDWPQFTTFNNPNASTEGNGGGDSDQKAQLDIRNSFQKPPLFSAKQLAHFKSLDLRELFTSLVISTGIPLSTVDKKDTRVFVNSLLGLPDQESTLVEVCAPITTKKEKMHNILPRLS